MFNENKFGKIIAGCLSIVALSVGTVLFTGCPEEPEMGPIEDFEAPETEEGDEMEMPEPDEEAQELPGL